MTNSTDPQPSFSIFKFKFLSQLNEAELGDWLARHGKNTLFLLGAFALLLLALFQFGGRSTHRTEADYIQASNRYALFMRGEDQPDNLKELMLLMNRYPELHAAYDGAVAQALLNEGSWIEANPLIEATLKRTDWDRFAAYRTFAETTLLVVQGKYAPALESAQALQQQLAEQLEKNAYGAQELFALNLLRIGVLQQQLGDTQGELKSWQAWKVYAGLALASGEEKLEKRYVDPAVFRSVIQELAQGSLALPDYFAFRQQTLEK